MTYQANQSEEADTLFQRIMNLPADRKVLAQMEGSPKGFYLLGHRDARHAAAELVAALPPQAKAEPAVDPVKHWCETCEGLGTIDGTLGGEYFSNPKATCPDCDGQGWWTPRAILSTAEPAGVSDEALELLRNLKETITPGADAPHRGWNDIYRDGIRSGIDMAIGALSAAPSTGVREDADGVPVVPALKRYLLIDGKMQEDEHGNWVEWVKARPAARGVAVPFNPERLEPDNREYAELGLPPEAGVAVPDGGEQ